MSTSVARGANIVGMPGYDARAARSTLRRYPDVLKKTLTRPSLTPWRIDQRVLRAMEAAGFGAVWLGHATVLLRMGDAWVLTDPVFSNKIGVRVAGVTLGVPRLAPAVDLESLPVPDVVLLSHAHFDHLDKPTLRALRNSRTRIVTAKNTAKLIPRGFGSVEELGWGEVLRIGGPRGGLEIRAIETKHWGARTMWDRHRGFNGYFVQGPAGTALFAGDTAYSEELGAGVRADLTMFGIGAYDPWIQSHANPEQVWEMHERTHGTNLMPIHHSTFELSDEPLHEPMERLLAAAGSGEKTIVGRSLGAAWISGEARAKISGPHAAPHKGPR